jgi:DNA-binding transcriptional regulator YiaG
MDAGLETQQAAADALDVDIRTVRRWDNGERTVPGPAWAALGYLRQLRDHEQKYRQRN